MGETDGGVSFLTDRTLTVFDTLDPASGKDVSHGLAICAINLTSTSEKHDVTKY